MEALLIALWVIGFIALVVTTFMTTIEPEWFVFWLMALLGFLIFYLFGADGVGGKPLVGDNLVFELPSGASIHIHHWMTLSVIAFGALLVGVQVGFGPVVLGVLGFCLGGSVEDLRFGTDIFMLFRPPPPTKVGPALPSAVEAYA